MPCTPKNKCRNIRECDYCAAIRQQQIGAVAEQIEAEHGQLTLTVLKPEENTAASIKALHASFMRRALAPAGIWTVETGEQFRRLHLNIISPKPLPAKWRGARGYSELLETTARDAAAYISKRQGIPDREQYPGRLYGAWGQVGRILATQERYPIVQAATLEVVLSGSQARREDEERFRVQYNKTVHGIEPRPARSKQEYGEIAARHLQTIRAMTGRATQ